MLITDLFNDTIRAFSLLISPTFSNLALVAASVGKNKQHDCIIIMYYITLINNIVVLFEFWPAESVLIKGVLIKEVFNKDESLFQSIV